MKYFARFIKIDYSTEVIIDACIDWFEEKFGFRPNRRQIIQFIISQVELNYDSIGAELSKIQLLIKEFPSTRMMVELNKKAEDKILKIFQNIPQTDVDISVIVVFLIISFYQRFVAK